MNAHDRSEAPLEDLASGSWPDLLLGKEWAALEMVAKGLRTPSEWAAFEELALSDSLDLGELIEQSLRHKMLPMVGIQLLSLPSFRKAVLPAIAEFLRQVIDRNRHAVQIWRTECLRICQVLHKEGVRFVCTKGITLESTVYGGSGQRIFNDLDFMISPSDRPRVEGILFGLGYVYGGFDWQSRRILPHDRRIILSYQLAPDHLPHMARLIDDSVVPSVAVDFANNFTWHGSPYDVPVDSALESIEWIILPETIQGRIPTFNPVFQFLFTSLHLFNEAWLETRITNNVNLVKFADVWRLWQHHASVLGSGALVETLVRFGVTDPVLWVLEYLDDLFKTDIVTKLALKGRITRDFLCSTRGPGGSRNRWSGNMRQQLQSKISEKITPEVA